MHLAVILLHSLFPAAAVLGAVGLLHCAPSWDPARHLAPAARTSALLCTATAAVLLLWSIT